MSLVWLVLAAVWLFGIPLVVAVTTIVCVWVDDRRARRDRGTLGVLLAFDPDRIPHERRHGGTW